MLLYEVISNEVMRLLTLSHAFFSTWVDVTNISDNTTPITISLQPDGGRFFQSLIALTVNGTARIADASSVLLWSMNHVFT